MQILIFSTWQCQHSNPYLCCSIRIPLVQFNSIQTVLRERGELEQFWRKNLPESFAQKYHPCFPSDIFLSMRTAKEKLHNYMNVSIFVENGMKRTGWDSSVGQPVNKNKHGPRAPREGKAHRVFPFSCCVLNSTLAHFLQLSLSVMLYFNLYCIKISFFLSC